MNKIYRRVLLSNLEWCVLVKPIMSFNLKDYQLGASSSKNHFFIHFFDIPSRLWYIFGELAGIEMNQTLPYSLSKKQLQ